MKKVLAFDMDGTIYDNSAIVVESYKRCVDDFNQHTGLHIATPSKESILKVIGLPPLDIFTGLMPGVDTKYADLMLELFMKELNSEVREDKGALYSGISKLIERFHDEGYELVVASNGILSYLETILDHYKLRTFFYYDIIVVDDKEIITKGDILARYKKMLAHDLCIMIGDRHTDRDAAIENKVPFVACAYGHAGTKEVEGEPYIVDSPEKIYHAVKEIEKSALT